MSWPSIALRLLLYMTQLDRFRETIASYHKHGWKLRRVLMCTETKKALAEAGQPTLDGIDPEVSSIDAVWFARPSHAGREAWELRLISESPYALFEAFDGNVGVEERDEMLRDMETRLSEYAGRN